MGEQELPQLAEISDPQSHDVGTKAASLAIAASRGFRVPPGFVVEERAVSELGDELDAVIARAASRIGRGPFAVRSSGVEEDLPDASYAGQYETFLNVESTDIPDAVRRTFASARNARVTAYEAARANTHDGSGSTPMAVLVQQMVAPRAAGVAFTANPLSGRRDEVIVSAVAGLAETLVSGAAVGERWIVTDAGARHEGDLGALDVGDALAVAALARDVEALFGVPQDIEWAIDDEGELFLIQARPMTALPADAVWDPPGPGVWSRNFRLGEWLPEAMTPLFAEWILPRLEEGFLDGAWATARMRLPFPYAVVNGWYYNTTPTPSPRALSRVLVDSRGRALWFAYNVVRALRDPAGADRAVLHALEDEWRTRLLPAYRDLVRTAHSEVDSASAERLVTMVDRVCSIAGQYLWSLAVVGGSAWKMEGALARFWTRHLAAPLDGTAIGDAGPQVLLRGLGDAPAVPAHAVYSLDWYFPTVGESDEGRESSATMTSRRGGGEALAVDRLAAEAAARDILREHPRLLDRFDRMLAVAQRYAVVREEQARDLTLGWPVLRRCARLLGRELTTAGTIDDVDDVFFLALDELVDTRSEHMAGASARRATWEAQRRLPAPIAIGTRRGILGDPRSNVVERARRSASLPKDAIVGHPASLGRATGRVRIITGPEDFPDFRRGEVLVAKATAPAWTQLFSLAAAVVTDGGSLVAHASLVAREFGIPAVVGTGNATTQLQNGQTVTVDGTAGAVFRAS